MSQFRSTPRLATPSILINQQVVGNDWPRLWNKFNDPPAIDRSDDSVQSPIVIKEAIQSLEHALIEEGDTPLDFMVLSTALAYQFEDRHVRMFLFNGSQTVHFVDGQWGTSATVPDRPRDPAPTAREAPRSPASAGKHEESSWGYTGTDRSQSTEPTVQLVPRPPHFVFQLLCGSRIGLDLVEPENELSKPA